MDHNKLQNLVGELYGVVVELENMFPGRPFTPDGHLVGSLGEVLVADAYGLELLPPSNQGFDAFAPDGRKVEIKATQGKRVSFRSCPEHAIVVQIQRNGTFQEVYNGPGQIIWDEVSGKPMPDNGQHQIGLTKLRSLASGISGQDRVPRKS